MSGTDYYHRQYNESKAEERRQIQEFKRTHPVEWAKAVSDVQAKEAQRIAAEAKDRADAIAAANLREQANKRCKSALLIRALPEIPDLQHVQGRIALRQWDLNASGWLTSNGHSSEPWQSQMIADRVPTPTNPNGLYCIDITPEAILGVAGNRVSDYCGIIELRGHIEYHEQEHGIRAEWARILGIYVLAQAGDAFSAVPLLREHYPNVPIFVTTRAYVAKYLVHIAMWRETGDERMLHNGRI